MPIIQPLILSGGAGSRLWPLSRAERPKQFLPLLSDQPMIVETARRFEGPDFTAPIVVCNVEHRFMAAEALRAGGVKPSRIILEPEGRNTAAAVALGALAAAERDPEVTLLAAAADADIKDLPAFQAAIMTAKPAADAGKLVTFGVTPDRPETGYGYIEAGAALGGLPGVQAITRFVEKPDAQTAAAYLASGAYLWNAGLFMLRADAAIAAFEAHAPDILDSARAALAGGREDLDFTRLDEAEFAKAPSQPFDIAIMEQTADGAVVPVDMGWSDVGGFAALWDISEKDAAGNATIGEAELLDVSGALAWADPGRRVAMIGLENVVAVATEDVTLLAAKDRAAEVKQLLARLEAKGAAGPADGATFHRPWGHYRTVDRGPGFQVKRITVKPRGKLSLQYHHHRAEHWVAVDGVATVTCGPNVDELKTFDLEPNQSTYIPIGAIHRLENRYERPLALIEVQTGHVLEEEDIVRLEDVYGR